MICAACGTENRPDARFCGECGSPLSPACPACGAANEPGRKFCYQCGTALESGAATAEPLAPATERRLVSVLFADLVGFTGLSENRDAEEVRELLSRYFEAARQVIERFGGTVEKFIGDAVMAVWGTPVAREDDPERAVRSALDLVDVVTGLGVELGASELAVRAAVLTGEAAVDLGAQGQGMVAGDLVNTASRAQALAPRGAVLVGERTRAATKAAIAYEEAGEQEIRGKVEGIRLWRALRVTAARRGARRADVLEAPFVGRDRELRLVKDLFHGTDEERRARLVSIVGIPGIGKSRLAWEFEKYLDGVVEDVWWHRGRCLPYGEGVAYWALAEMVRMRAGIAEADEPASAQAKLRETLEPLFPDADERGWAEIRLAHLLGLAEHGGQDRQDLFSAWRLLFERLAERGPCVLVFEDLQWADSGLLDFIEYLLEWSRAYPLYLVTLARPELAERRPDWGAGKRNFHSLFLEPLAGEAMDALLAGLVPGLPAELRGHIRDRADGVPLYAVETVRMLLDRGLVERVGDEYRPAGPIEALEVPDSLHALIAARLDGLEPDERRLVADASVLGKTFTTNALAALTGRSGDALERPLAALVRKEVLSVQADPRSPERGQYGFLQALVQRVAHDTLSRKERKARHLAAAAYFESSSSFDQYEIAEVIASHLLDAYNAEPDAEDAAEIKSGACDRLASAGERAGSLGAPAEAQRYFEHAADLADEPGHQATMLERAGEMAVAGVRPDDALLNFERAIGLFEANGDDHAAARMLGRLGKVLETQGQTGPALERMERSFEILSREEPDEGLALLAGELARAHFFTGNLPRAWERVELALEVAERLMLPEVLSESLNTKHLILGQGWGRHQEGEGLLRQALRIALDHGIGASALRASFNLAHVMETRDRGAEAFDLDREGLALARKRGDRMWELFFLMHMATRLQERGEWDEALERAAEIPMGDPNVPHAALMVAVPVAMIHAERGNLDAARPPLELFGRELDAANVQAQAAYDLARSAVLLAEGHTTDALEAAEASFGVRDRLGVGHPLVKPGFTYACQAALVLGDLDRVEGLIAETVAIPPGSMPPSLVAQRARFAAQLAARRGDVEGTAAKFEEAVTGLRAVDHRFWLAVALLEQAEWLSSAGRLDEAEPFVVEARELFTYQRASSWLERASKLPQAPTASATTAA
jgi:class 3 adenylate cyclase/tetratricopeptide (TPR) repeat protein